MLGAMRRAAVLMVIAVLGACHRGGAARPHPTEEGEWLTVPGAERGLYAYGSSIAEYAHDDRGGYVVVVSPEAGGDAARAEIAARAGDDVLGDDAYVMRMTARERDALRARAGVVGVVPLQPGDRSTSRAGLDGRDVRIDLFDDASADEVAAVAAWIAWRGGAVRWRGPRSLVASLPTGAIADAARLSPVRWVE